MPPCAKIISRAGCGGPRAGYLWSSTSKGATSMQTHPEVRVGLELATDGIQFYVFYH